MNLAVLQQKYPGAETFTFGDGEALCTALNALMAQGKQTATCGALRDFGAEGENESLGGWRKDRRAYFERNGGWADYMLPVCERFRLIEVLE